MPSEGNACRHKSSRKYRQKRVSIDGITFVREFDKKISPGSVHAAGILRGSMPRKSSRMTGSASVFLCACILMMAGGCARAVKPSSPMDNPKEHYLTGLKILDDKDPLKPETEFRRAISLDKKSPYGYTGMAAMHLNRRQFGRALRYTNRALKNDPKFADAVFIRGGCISNGKKTAGWRMRSRRSRKHSNSSRTAAAHCITSARHASPSTGSMRRGPISSAPPR